jgi:hypothetical protein
VIVLPIERLTTGTESDRILEAYYELRPIAYDDVGELLVADADYDEVRAEIEDLLRSISVTWTIHLRVLEPYPYSQRWPPPGLE